MAVKKATTTKKKVAKKATKKKATKKKAAKKAQLSKKLENQLKKGPLGPFFCWNLPFTTTVQTAIFPLNIQSSNKAF